MQVVIKKIAWLMQITMKTSAVESLNAAGNIFIGQVHSLRKFLNVGLGYSKTPFTFLLTMGFSLTFM